MSDPIFSEGELVWLRTIEDEDWEFLTEIYNHPDVLPNLTWDKPRNTQQFREKFEEEMSQPDRIDLLIESDGEEIGHLLILEKDEGVAEMGIWMPPENQNKGYGTDACRQIIDYAFNELRYQKIFVRTYENNKASQKP